MITRNIDLLEKLGRNTKSSSPTTYPDKKDNSNRQVWNLMGDGAYNLSYPDLLTNVAHNLPVIKVVFSNTKFAFNKNKYKDTNENIFSCDFTDVDYVKVAKAQGAVGYTVRRIEEIDEVVRKQ